MHLNEQEFSDVQYPRGYKAGPVRRQDWMPSIRYSMYQM